MKWHTFLRGVWCGMEQGKFTNCQLNIFSSGAGREGCSKSYKKDGVFFGNFEKTP